MHRALKTCQKPQVITKKSQLSTKKISRDLNTTHLIKWQKNESIFTEKMALRKLLLSFWAWMTSIFHASQFFINSEHILDILRAKSSIHFSPCFCPFFTARPTSEYYNYPLKVLTEGSVVEYLAVGPQEAPQTIFGKKKFPAPKS